MEMIVADKTASNPPPVRAEPPGEKAQNDIFEISSNWWVSKDKSLRNTVTTVLQKDFSGSMPLEDIAYEHTSIEIQPKPDYEPCTIDIKLKNGQRIVRIAIASEAEVLEIFKESGEYAATMFSEFIDEFEGCTVYLGGIVFDKPTREASIKFTRVKNERSSVFIYGIRLVLDDSKPSNSPRSEESSYNTIISDFLTLLKPKRNNLTGKASQKVGNSRNIILKDSGMAQYVRKLENKTSASPADSQSDDSEKKAFKSNKKATKPKFSANNNNSPGEQPANYSQTINGSVDLSGLQSIIDTKLGEMENRLMERIAEVERNTNKTLAEILSKLETLTNAK
ncbi:uncharacterized protein LOC135170929 [Diachasmimorpha longicaudata]|uniref:uncharacterized protein LOC135170929 n=1 Tax=Diachasmimorpha longicaudata TaxID=58733 RepID=UPI0030B8E915